MVEMCLVPTCIDVAVPAQTFCRIHKYAALARNVGASGGCLHCGRAIGPNDYVNRTPVGKKSRTTKTTSFHWVHAACHPRDKRPSKKALREAVKPLLAGLEP